jgi:hypothetical protein
MVGACSQVLVVRRALDILDVGFLIEFDSAIGQLLVGDPFLSTRLTLFARSTPVPVKSAYVLETGHFFVRKVCDNFNHSTAVTIEAEHIMVDKMLPVEELKGCCAHSKFEHEESHMIKILKQKSLHLLIIYLLYNIVDK